MIYNRKSQKLIEEKSFGSSSIDFLYTKQIGNLLLDHIAKKLWFSRLMGMYYSSPFSKKKIASFIETYQIDMSLYEEKAYLSFNDFFVRKMKKEREPSLEQEATLIAPCSSKVRPYPIDETLKMMIKGREYTVGELLKDTQIAADYVGGTCMIFRLAMDDYHRYCYIDEGSIVGSKKIKGYLHTVRGIALDYCKVYTENSREYAVLQTRNFGKVIQMEIGAILVGKIKNKPRVVRFEKGNEKGYFSFGGSTIVLLFQKGVVTIHKDILEASAQGYETKVQIYETIGEKSC